MKKEFGSLPNQKIAYLYTISCGDITAEVSDLGATLVRLLVPDAKGNVADVVLGYNHPEGYMRGTACFGATVGRNANRTKGASFQIGNRVCTLAQNDNHNNLHSGPDYYHTRLWEVKELSENSVTFFLRSPAGDQGFPGNAEILVTYRLDSNRALHIVYDAVCDQDTVFNLTNHSYFNLAGHQHPEEAVHQILTIPGRFFCVDDHENIPTGELRCVDGTPMDFRSPKPISRDLDADYAPLHLQYGYDHSWEVFCNPCAILNDPHSGRTMSVSTDCPGIQVYSGNFVQDQGKDGIFYGKHSGIALETQFHPDSVHHPEWAQPFTKAGEKYHSETVFHFSI